METKKTETKLSPALGLLDYVWQNTPRTSWRVVNESMQIAIKLAVVSGMEWAIGDCKHINDHYRPGYWMGEQSWEPSYSLACDGPRGPNASAIKAIEAHLGRKAFIVVKAAHEGAKIRLHVGVRFDWHDNLKDRIPNVKVTSFSTRKVAGKDGKEIEVPCVVAYSYVREKKDSGNYSYETDKVDRVFKITHDDIAAYHKAIRDHKKKTETPAESAA
jgi:hypothetical protein